MLKYFSYLSITLIIACIFSCKKNDEYPKGNAQAQLNGNNWEAERVFATPSVFGNKDLMEIYIVKDHDQPTSQHMMFGNVRKTMDSQRLYISLKNQDSAIKSWQ